MSNVKPAKHTNFSNKIRNTAKVILGKAALHGIAAQTPGKQAVLSIPK
jgi:hypothetical protein